MQHILHFSRLFILSANSYSRLFLSVMQRNLLVTWPLALVFPPPPTSCCFCLYFIVFTEHQVVFAEDLLLTLGCVFFSSTAIVHHIHTKVFSTTIYFFKL